MKTPGQKPNNVPEHNSDVRLPDIRTTSALDAMVASNEQTYGQFLQGFVHLTAADVAPSVMQNAFGAGVPQQILSLSQEKSRTLPQIPQLILQPEPCPRPPSPVLANNIKANTDEDFEEVLDCSIGSSSNIRQETMASRLQMDNFVEDEASDSDEDMKELGTEYSVNTSLKGNNHSRGNMSRLSCMSEGSSIKSGKSTLLPQSIVFKSQPQNKEEESILDLIEKCDNDAGSHFSRGVVEGKEEELVYDPSLDVPNPGEIDPLDEQTTLIKTNNRSMDYSARIAESGETPSFTSSTQKADKIKTLGNPHPVLDDVQPFSLDEDFDYDNVILTPKFTPEEQTELDEFARKGRERIEQEMAATKEES